MPRYRTATRRTAGPVASSTPDAALAIPLSILTHPGLTPLQKNTLALIAATGNQEQETLARWQAVSLRAVAGAVRRLRRVGLLDVVPRGAGRGNAYMVRAPAEDAAAREIAAAMGAMDDARRREAWNESRAGRTGPDYKRYLAALRSMREEALNDHNARAETEWRRVTHQGG